jgi:hypothetical protein
VLLFCRKINRQTTNKTKIISYICFVIKKSNIMNEDYKKLLKIAKSRRINNADDLRDLVDEVYPDCNGGEWECAKQILKIKE